MVLVPTDLPQRLQSAGLKVHVMSGWESRGSSADHKAVVLHWTASGSKESPSSCANYCFLNAEYAPDYNLLVDRNGEVWVGAREKSNSSGKISGTALNEALRGQTNWASAASRGLSDTTSANQSLWAISAQNNGVGEPWSEALKNGMATAAGVSLNALGLSSAGFVTHHMALTARKIDLTPGTGGCPSGSEWHSRITTAMKGGGPSPAPPKPEEQEMWTISATIPAGTSREDAKLWQCSLPYGRKSCRVDYYVDTDPKEGVSLWACCNMNGKNFGLWANGNTWEQWVPGRKPTAVEVRSDAKALSFKHMGGTKAALLVTVSGT